MKITALILKFFPIRNTVGPIKLHIPLAWFIDDIMAQHDMVTLFPGTLPEDGSIIIILALSTPKPISIPISRRQFFNPPALIRKRPPSHAQNNSTQT